MQLNKIQKTILVIFIITSIGMGIYPPWKETIDTYRLKREDSAGYSFINSPPKVRYSSYSEYSGMKIDIDRLLVQWAILFISSVGLILVTASSSNNRKDKSLPSTNNLNEAFPFTGDMPDITKLKPIKAYQVGENLGLVLENALPIAETVGGIKSSITYPFVFVIIDTKAKKPVHFVTLEKNISGSIFLCCFEKDGSHKNLGEGEAFMDMNKFIEKSRSIISSKFSIPLASISELKG